MPTTRFTHFFTRRVRIVLASCAGLLLLFGLIGALALPLLLRPWLEKQASVALRREVTIGKVEINPYLLRATLRDVAVNEKDGALLKFAALSADAELSSLWHQAPVLREITLQAPQLRIVRLDAVRYNFSDLLAAKTPAKADSAPARFSLNNIRIIGGRIDFDDRYKQSHHAISELNLALPFVSTLPQRLNDYIEPGLSGKLDDARFRLTGKSKPFQSSHETRVSLSLSEFDLPDYLAYVPLPKDLTLPSGKLSGQVDVVFRQERDAPRLQLEGRLALANARLDYRGAPILSLPAVSVELKALEPLTQQYRFAKVRFDKPAVTVSRDAASRINWIEAFAPDKASGKTTRGKPAAPTASTPAPLVEIAEFALNEGRIDWQDAAVRPAQNEHIEAIGINAQRFSTAAKASSPVSLGFQTGNGETFKADLQVTPSPLALDGRIALENLQPGRHAVYLKPFLAGEIADGKLSTALKLRFAAEPQALQISDGTFSVRDLALKLAGEKQPLVRLAALDASGIAMDQTKRQVSIADIAAHGGEIRAALEKDGKLNLQRLTPPAGDSTPAAKPADSPAWRVNFGQIALDRHALQVEDRRHGKAPPLALSDISLKLRNLDNASGSPALLDLAARAGKRGQLKLSGPFVAQPFSAKWKVDVRQFDAAFARPYFTDYLNIELASIWLGAKGEVAIATTPKTAVHYRGNLAVNQLHAIDKLNGADFLKWRALALNGINVQSEPLRLDLNEVALSDFYSRLILSKEGRLNLQDIVVQNGQAASVTTAASTPAAKPAPIASAPVKAREPLPPVRIGRITLAGGNINYTDNFIQPNFTANLMDMGGAISGLSSRSDTRASVDLRGSVDHIAPVTVAGSLNPLAQPMFLDIKAAVKGYELAAASTYSAKYAGYGIEKGKLSMDVAYFIENGQLKASNHLNLDQLTLGEPVDSPQATKLPVRFALALLTDRRGQINLNLPIEGSLDDPQFRIGRIIWQVLGNILTKAVTSPFSALGALFGGQEESFSRVEFAPGRFAIDPAAQESLGKLAQALADRPALKLDIAGWAAPEADREGLRREKLEAKIRARKLAQLADQGQSIAAEQLNITEPERTRLLEQVYAREKFAKPRNLVGLAKSLPVAEMEKLILANTPISDDDLRELALRRATIVKDALQAAGVDESRLFLLKPRLDPPPEDQGKDGGKATRVQFMLK